jgi:hypothetical protein
VVGRVARSLGVSEIKGCLISKSGSEVDCARDTRYRADVTIDPRGDRTVTEWHRASVPCTRTLPRMRPTIAVR